MKTSIGFYLPVGTKIKFVSEAKRYTVQASNEHFAVCTYPINIIRKLGRWGEISKGKAYEHEKTVMYTVIDFDKGIRGTENLIFGFGAETRESCEEMLTRLSDPDESERTEVSSRNWRKLDLEAVFTPKGVS